MTKSKFELILEDWYDCNAGDFDTATELQQFLSDLKREIADNPKGCVSVINGYIDELQDKVGQEHEKQLEYDEINRRIDELRGK